MAEIPTFNSITTFDTIPIGGEFIEVLTTCNEVATRIAPEEHEGKPVNALRSGGKLIFMAEWEPVLVEEYEDRHFYSLYWECPDCDGAVSISVDNCPVCE